MIQLTPTRRLWLEKLAASNHPVPWRRMPARANGKGAVTNGTWRPMIEAGWITGKYETRDFRIGADWHFQITESGRAVLAKGCSSDDGYCKSCDGDFCTAGPKCVAASNPPDR